MSKPSTRSALRPSSGLRRTVQQWAFSALYHFGGPIYDAFARFVFGDAWSRWRAAVLGFVETGPVLDLGCGTGVLIEQLDAQDLPAFGVDREPSMLRRAIQRPRARGRVIRADASSLPFRDRSFASVLATFPARFILDPVTLTEVMRVLRPGGRFVVLMSGETSEKARWRAPLRLALWLFYGRRQTHELPDAGLLAVPGLNGEWRWVEQGVDRVLIWIALRGDE